MVRLIVIREETQLFGEQYINGYWYYFDKEKNGEMLTGWCQVPGSTGESKIVYYNQNGQRLHGEQRIDGYWYYFDETTVRGQQAGKNYLLRVVYIKQYTIMNKEGCSMASRK